MRPLPVLPRRRRRRDRTFVDRNRQFVAQKGSSGQGRRSLRLLDLRMAGSIGKALRQTSPSLTYIARPRHRVQARAPQLWSLPWRRCLRSRTGYLPVAGPYSMTFSSLKLKEIDRSLLVDGKMNWICCRVYSWTTRMGPSAWRVPRRRDRTWRRVSGRVVDFFFTEDQGRRRRVST